MAICHIQKLSHQQMSCEDFRADEDFSEGAFKETGIKMEHSGRGLNMGAATIDSMRKQCDFKH